MRDNTIEEVRPRQGKTKKGNPRRSSSGARKQRMARKQLTIWLARQGLTPEAIDDAMKTFQSKGLKTAPLASRETCSFCGAHDTFIVSAKDWNGKSVAMMLCCRTLVRQW